MKYLILIVRGNGAGRVCFGRGRRAEIAPATAGRVLVLLLLRGVGRGASLTLWLPNH